MGGKPRAKASPHSVVLWASRDIIHDEPDDEIWLYDGVPRSLTDGHGSVTYVPTGSRWRTHGDIPLDIAPGTCVRVRLSIESEEEA